jgi:hypothetical protein
MVVGICPQTSVRSSALLWVKIAEILSELRPYNFTNEAHASRYLIHFFSANTNVSTPSFGADLVLHRFYLPSKS